MKNLKTLIRKTSIPELMHHYSQGRLFRHLSRKILQVFKVSTYAVQPFAGNQATREKTSHGQLFTELFILTSLHMCAMKP
ncbi:MAG: hypothetical protein DRH04_06345 [Deltaproteobacteria bacterium]|nr:MAG: hypothetical protein DRH04_06345 [Deltaproteobacteria bacterium]